METPTKFLSKDSKKIKGLSDPSYTAGVSVPVYTVVDDDRSANYESAQFQDDWNDWTPNSWGY
jgi:hypothetical protein